MVDNAMFYLIGTVYPLVARATYPTLGFAQYPGEAGDLRGRRRDEGEGAQGRRGRAREPLDVYRSYFLADQPFIGGDHPSIADIRLAATSSSCG